jgi:superfamily II DNA or RNA helicase
MIILRPYQITLMDAVLSQFRKGCRRVIMQLETGGGKTFTFCYMAANHLAKNPANRVLILTDRTVLMQQTGGALMQIGIDADYIAPGHHIDYTKNIFVGMVETVNRRTEELQSISFFSKITLVIIDEAHKGNFRKLLDLFENAYIIGATATPISGNKKQPLNKFFDGIASTITTKKLIEEGNLTPYDHICPDLGIDESTLQKRLGEYTDRSQLALLDKFELYEGLHNLLTEYGGGKTLVFCINIEHTRQTFKHLTAKGVNCLMVHSGMLEYEKAGVIGQFEDLESGMDVLINCGILTTGYDFPAIQTVILNRKIGSLPLYRQMIGRGSRPCKAIGKERFKVIDMANNYLEHGFWDDNIDWVARFWGEGTKKRDGVAPIKFCPQCETLLSASARKCTNCGHEFPKSQAEQLEVFGGKVANRLYLSELDKIKIQSKSPYSMTLKELLIFKQLGKNGVPYSEKWLISILQKRKGGVEAYARLKGYPPEWVRKNLY